MPLAAMLHNPRDRSSLLFHALVLVVYGLAFAIWAQREALGVGPGFESMAFGIGAALLLGWLSALNLAVHFHNHAHNPISTGWRLNRWLARSLTVSAGWPAFFWYHSHLRVHHPRLLAEGDWTQPRRRAGALEPALPYCLAHWPWRAAVHLWRDLRPPQASAEVARVARRELALFLLAFALPIVLEPKGALLLWVLPAWLANVLFMAPAELRQHGNCAPPGAGQLYQHSNTTPGRLFNFTRFNFGYHLEHHAFPRVHWSELPLLHQTLAPDVAREHAALWDDFETRGARAGLFERSPVKAAILESEAR